MNDIRKEIWRADDPVNHPSHYTNGDVECIDALEASMEPIEFCGFLKGNVMKYVWRFEKKASPAEDLSKAQWYLDRLLKYVKAHPDIPFDGRKEFAVSLADATMPEEVVKKALEKDPVQRGA